MGRAGLFVSNDMAHGEGRYPGLQGKSFLKVLWAEFASFAPQLEEIDKLHSHHDMTRPPGTSSAIIWEKKKKPNSENWTLRIKLSH